MDSDTPPPARVGRKTDTSGRSAAERRRVRSAAERLQAAENKVVVLGLSHKTASVDIRERLAVQECHWQVFLATIAIFGLQGADLP